jgi:hypothetical protein
MNKIEQSEKVEKELSPKEELDSLSEKLFTVGIAIIIFVLVVGLANLIGGDIYNAISFVGTLLIKFIGPVLIILVFFIGAILAKLGTLIEDKEEQEVYLGLIYLFWIGDLFITPLLSIGYIAGVISASFIVGLGFIFFIAPPFVFGILKGACYLFELVIADFCHNPFK